MYKLFIENKKTKKRVFIGSYKTIGNASLYVFRMNRLQQEDIIFVLSDRTGPDEWQWDGDCWVDPI